MSPLFSSSQGDKHADLQLHWYPLLSIIDVLFSLSPLLLFLHLQQKDPPHEAGPALGFSLLKRSPSWPLLTQRSASEFLVTLKKADVRWFKESWVTETTFNLIHLQNKLIQERRNSRCFFSMAGTWSHPVTETKLVKRQDEDGCWQRW